MNDVVGTEGGAATQSVRTRLTLHTLAFVLGLSAVFVALGFSAGLVSNVLFDFGDVIRIVAGAFLVLMGVIMLRLIPIPFLQRDMRIHRVPAVGVAAAPMLGVLFGLGWTPCIGPTLAAVNALAMNEASALRGAILSLVYAVGLGLPFIVAALAFRRMLGTVRWVRRHQVWLTRAGGAMLVVVGLLLVSGLWDRWVYQLTTWYSGFSVAI